MKRVALALAPIAGLVALMVFDIPICPTRMIFGIPCPGCGLTRATRALVELDLATAAAMHPLVFVLAPLVAYVLGRNVLVAAGLLSRAARDPIDRVPHFAWTSLVVVLVLVWAVRLTTDAHPDGVTFCDTVVARVTGICVD